VTAELAASLVGKRVRAANMIGTVESTLAHAPTHVRIRLGDGDSFTIAAEHVSLDLTVPQILGGAGDA